MHRRTALICLPLLLGANHSRAQPGRTPPSELAAELPGAQWRGAVQLRFLGLHIYDLRLWAPLPVTADYAGQALALELQYARSLGGPRIAQRSIDEMRRIGPLSDEQADRWLLAMVRLFPDVVAGDRLTGVQRPGQGARFHFNGTLRGEVAEPEFARLFFGMWLSPKTSEPKLRAELLASAG